MSCTVTSVFRLARGFTGAKAAFQNAVKFLQELVAVPLVTNPLEIAAEPNQREDHPTHDYRKL